MPPVTPDRISLPDRYRVVRHLANGGMASVWEAHDELLDRDVAVKLLASHLGEDVRARKRFQREARAAAGLSSHPNVVTIYDVGEHRSRVFMVMELMRGGTLGDRLKSGSEIPYETGVRWLHEAAAALDAAHHAGVVHRDIKPGNLLLDGRQRLAVADFGIARLAWEDQLTATGQVLGTAAYLSPEQALGEAATAASDRYALAVVAYELLTGSRPFEAEHFAAQARAHVEDPPPPASSRAPELSRAVDAALERGLAKSPGDRWDSSEEFVSALERTLLQAGSEPTKPTRKLGLGRRAKGAAAAAGLAAGADARGADGGRSGAADDADDLGPGGRGAHGAAADDGGDDYGPGARGAAADDYDGRGAAPDPYGGGRGGRDVDRRGNAARGRAGGGVSATRRRAAAAGGGRGAASRGRGAPSGGGSRRSAAPLLIGLAAIALIAVVGAIALANRGAGDGDRAPSADNTPEATASAERTEEPTPDPTEEATPDPTEEPTPDPTETATPDATAAAPSGSPTELQARGHTALLNGDIDTALANLQSAVQSCGDSTQVDPCAYAMYDYGTALVEAGRPQEAVQVLEARLARFDNQNGTVRALLKEARKASRGGGDGDGDGD